MNGWWFSRARTHIRFPRNCANSTRNLLSATFTPSENIQTYIRSHESVRHFRIANHKFPLRVKWDNWNWITWARDVRQYNSASYCVIIFSETDSDRNNFCCCSIATKRRKKTRISIKVNSENLHNSYAGKKMELRLIKVDVTKLCHRTKIK